MKDIPAIQQKYNCNSSNIIATVKRPGTNDGLWPEKSIEEKNRSIWLDYFGIPPLASAVRGYASGLEY